jgi:hypothetical protein
MRKTVVTSFTEDGYRTYGKDFIESFRKHWPSDVDLVVYYEGDNIREDWHFIEEVEGLEEWMERIDKFPLFKGDLGDGTYDIQRDARMVRKCLIQTHAAKVYGGKVFWIDADVFTFDDIPSDFLDKMLPDDKFSCFLGRDHWPEAKSGQLWPSYTESGFLGFNVNHPLAPHFFGAYLEIPRSGMLFTMESWHDCICYDLARHAFKNNQDDFVNITGNLPANTHPFVNSVLGKYMDHKKGKRKTSKSKPEDMVVERSEAYWSEKEDGPVIVTDPASAWG